MTLHNFIAKLNWRQILVHFIAFWFFIHAFQILSYLYNIKFLEAALQPSQKDTIKYLTDNNFSAVDLTNSLIWTGVSGFIGLITAFLISLAISIRRHWFWANSVFVLVVTYTLYKLDLLGWSYLKRIFLIPGHFFNTIVFKIMVDGFLLLLIGLLLFLLNMPKRFIERSKLAPL